MNPINLNEFLSFFAKLNILEKGYNIINSLTYSIIGIVIYFFIVYPYLLLRDVKINYKFIISVLIFTIMGAILRMFSESNLSFNSFIVKSTNPLSLGFYFYYPNLFIFLTILFLITFEFINFLAKKYDLDKEDALIILSLLLLCPLILFLVLNIVNWILLIIILVSSYILFFIFVFLFKKFKFNLLKNKISKLAFFSQILDGFITFFSINYLGNLFYEKHVLSSLIISIDPILFLVIKIIFCLFLLFLIDKFVLKKDLNNYFKLFIIIIGFSTALRNLFIIILSFL